MKQSSATYFFRHKLASLIMMVALVWLTVSLPYVNAFQQEVKKTTQPISTETGGAEEDSNPFAGTTEEKTENGANTLSEYLHDLQIIEHHFITLASYYKCHPSDLYFAFHPESLSPPPDQA